MFIIGIEAVFRSRQKKRTSAMAATQPRTRAQKRRRAEAEEAKMGKNLATMPPLVLLKIAEHLEHYDRIAFASTCTAFRDAIWEVAEGERKEGEEDKKKLVTNLTKAKLLERPPCFSLLWFKWVHRSFERQDKELNDSDLLELAAFQGSVDALQYLKASGVALDVRYWWCGRKAAEGGQKETLE